MAGGRETGLGRGQWHGVGKRALGLDPEDLRVPNLGFPDSESCDLDSFSQGCLTCVQEIITPPHVVDVSM